AEEDPGPPLQIAEQGERRWHGPEPRRAEVGRPGTKCKLPGNPERDRAEVVGPADTGRMQQVVPHRVMPMGGLMPDNAGRKEDPHHPVQAAKAPGEQIGQERAGFGRWPAASGLVGRRRFILTLQGLGEVLLWRRTGRRTVQGGLSLNGLQHVTCRIALVYSASCFSVSIAWVVGRMSNSILRRLASVFTSFITGSPPYAPMPTTRRWHFQGISSSMDNGVWPKESRNFFDGFFLRLWTSPR